MVFELWGLFRVNTRDTFGCCPGHQTSSPADTHRPWADPILRPTYKQNNVPVVPPNISRPVHWGLGSGLWDVGMVVVSLCNCCWCGGSGWWYGTWCWTLCCYKHNFRLNYIWTTENSGLKLVFFSKNVEIKTDITVRLVPKSLKSKIIESPLP